MAHEHLRKTFFDGEANDLLDTVVRHFQTINEGIGLTDEDKRRLKEYYLAHFVTDRARTLLKRHFPEQFGDLVPSIRDLAAKFG